MVWPVCVRLLISLSVTVFTALALGFQIPSNQLAYESRLERQDYNLHLLDIRRRLPVRIFHTDADERYPTWSPDGERLAFASNRNGNWSIYIGSMRTGKVQQLTRNGHDLAPAWSPDGRAIAFHANRDGNLELYTLQLDEQTTPDRLTFGLAADRHPAWSPDGKNLVYESYFDNDLDVYVMNLENGTATNQTDTLLESDWGAAWSPGGDRLAYASTRGGHWDVYMLELSSGKSWRVTNTQLDVAHPVWSPDGQWLVVEAYGTLTTRSLYLMPSDLIEADSAALVRLTHLPTDNRMAVWRPNTR